MHSNEVKWTEAVWTAKCLGGCGRLMKPRTATYLPHLPNHKGKGMCKYCYDKSLPPTEPTDFKVCHCGRLLVARSQIKPKGFHYNAGRGQCAACKRIESKESEDAKTDA